MNTLRALIGTVPLAMLFVAALVALIVAVVGLLLGVVGLLVSIVGFLLLICIAIPVFSLIAVGTIIEFIPSIFTKRPVWSCRAGKALINGGGNLMDGCMNFVEHKMNGVESTLDQVDYFMDKMGQIDAWFGTSIFYGRIISWANNVCTGGSRQKSLAQG